MTKVTAIQKAASINPLKSSQPLGAAFAFLGVEGAMPLFHGGQGCTSFALVLFVRHFKETIPLQTTALDEVATILGGADHLEEALLNLKARANPKLIGVCTTALVETRGEDFAGDLALIKERRACELAGTEIVLVQTPDFDGAIEEGWSKAVTALIDNLVPPEASGQVIPNQINILPGWHLTVADLELLREAVEAFGLTPNIVPDISGALDGTVPDRWIPTTYGGVPVESIRSLGRATHTIAIGEHMRRPAQRLAETSGIPFTLFESLSSLASVDIFVTLLAQLSGRAVPPKIRRRRRQLEDALLDGHFFFSGKRIAIAAEPDHLYALATFVTGLGAEVAVAVTTTLEFARSHQSAGAGGEGRRSRRFRGSRDRRRLRPPADPQPWQAGRRAAGHSTHARRFPDLRSARQPAPAHHSLRRSARPGVRSRKRIPGASAGAHKRGARTR